MMVVALVVIVALVFLALFVLVDLAGLPGRVAHSRGHPQAEAVKMAGILGMLSGIMWLLALVWAYYRPKAKVHATSDPSQEVAALKARITDLEAQLTQGTAGEGGKTK